MVAMISVICVGRLKEPHYAAAAAEYLKRLGRYVKVDVTEFRECTDKSPEVQKRREADSIIGKLDSSSYVIVLDASGRQYHSSEFARLLSKPDVTFIIGGPEGLHQSVLDEADLALSLSEMTFPHQLARVILLEQIYRGETILRGEKYHR